MKLYLVAISGPKVIKPKQTLAQPTAIFLFIHACD